MQMQFGVYPGQQQVLAPPSRSPGHGPAHGGLPPGYAPMVVQQNGHLAPPGMQHAPPGMQPQKPDGSRPLAGYDQTQNPGVAPPAGILPSLQQMGTDMLQMAQQWAPAPQPQEAPPNLPPKEAAVDQVLANAATPCRIRRHPFKANLPLGAIGKGAFGVVYRSRRGNYPEEYAVKMIENYSRQSAMIAREIEILGTLNHPSIVNMVDVIKDRSQDWMFIVMEFVEGGDLREKLTQQPQCFDESFTRVLFFHIGAALAHAHDRGILHRDIKPENVLLCKDGFPKVADFGMSRNTKLDSDNFEWGKTCAGTPFYQAPEVFHHHAAVYSFPADVFSAGNLLLDMLHPDVVMVGVFDRMNPHEKEKFKKRWPSPVKPQFSPALKNIQKRMSAQMPGQRGTMFQTCHELLEQSKRDPAKHPFWTRKIILPPGPPVEKTLDRDEAADIAGKLGYAEDCGVNIFVQGQWLPGYVRLICHDVCPGGLWIVFKDKENEQKKLVPPWLFQQMLRPNPKALQLFLNRKKSGRDGPSGQDEKRGPGGKGGGRGGRGGKDAAQQKCCSIM